MRKLTTDEAQARLGSLKNWTLEGDAIRKQYVFGSFREAVSFTVRLAFEAEEADHHPEIAISYKRVTLVYSTHAAGGLTERDFAGAAAADRISWV
ncbi:MAG: 4a-hydroxytetrahydrobiopterin dehydratase [Acidobacteria bacterium]|nr:4a-hydroxytetrahydrobiopterin dehydratase [Acidobacteriota bacterium]